MASSPKVDWSFNTSDRDSSSYVKLKKFWSATNISKFLAKMEQEHPDKFEVSEPNQVLITQQELIQSITDTNWVIRDKNLD